MVLTRPPRSGGCAGCLPAAPPLTGVEVVDMIITELAVIEVTREGLVLREVAPGVTPEEIQKVTEPKLRVAKNLKTISL